MLLLVVAILFVVLRAMLETAPAATSDTALVPMENPLAKKRGRRPGVLPGSSRKASSLSVSKLITEALSVSQGRAGVSAAALKKVLAAAGYDVEKNNSRIKLGLKSLVSKGTLVQTKGTGASGSFKLNKKSIPESTTSKVKRPASAQGKKLTLPKDSKSPKSAKTTKTAKKSRKAAAPKAPRSGGKAKGARGKQPGSSSGKARAGKLQSGKVKVTQRKTRARKVASKK
ncbi:histone H1t [Suricata suricatta]|uniref:histone H1t n=1 Tax=Suricata suricatta TaxID=37032 RepID=UPI0011559F5A|nr:histone H1t [Suricata suricatta]